MSSVRNPYAAPKALVIDVDVGNHDVQTVKVFSIEGRIGRLRLMVYCGAAYLFVTGFSHLGAVVPSISYGGGYANVAINMLGRMAIVPGIVLIVMWTIQRGHDMDWRGWTAVLAFLPGGGFVWVMEQGSAGRNRFGAPPPPNGLFIKVFGLVVLLVAVARTILAIVELTKNT